MAHRAHQQEATRALDQLLDGAGGAAAAAVSRERMQLLDALSLRLALPVAALLGVGEGGGVGAGAGGRLDELEGSGSDVADALASLSTLALAHA